jgi:glycosyltransferase involved in cell wall biosynthesis
LKALGLQPKTMVDVSVVIPTYNRASQVKEAIDSVLGQSKAVREIIVVDDGSSDGTREALLAYGSSIQVLFPPKGGASAARNCGMRAAQGQWIAFLDDDDVWLPSKIERQLELASLNPALALVYCDDYAVDEQLQILYRRAAASENRGDVFERLLVKNFIFTSCVIARRDAIEKAGYMDLEFKFAQDWDLWLKIAAEHPVDFVGEPLVLYRQSNSACLTRDINASDRLDEMRTISERALAMRKVPRRIERRARFELHCGTAANFLIDGKNGQAFWPSCHAVASQPGSFEGYRLLAYSVIPAFVRKWVKNVAGITRSSGKS